LQDVRIHKRIILHELENRIGFKKKTREVWCSGG
jgi:hypothetical protein